MRRGKAELRRQRLRGPRPRAHPVGQPELRRGIGKRRGVIRLDRRPQPVLRVLFLSLIHGQSCHGRARPGHPRLWSVGWATASPLPTTGGWWARFALPTLRNQSPLPNWALFANQRHDGPSGQSADRRFRRPIHPADRAAGAGGGRLFGDRALRQGRGCAKAGSPQGHHPLRRAGIGARDRHAAAVGSNRQFRRAHPRHLLWRAGDGGCPWRPGGRRAHPRVRPCRARDHRRHAAVPRCVAAGNAGAGMDEPWRPRHQAAGGLPRRGGVERRAVRGHRRRCPQALWRAVPSGGRAHA